MNWWQALILGALQGISELFPISSLGHLALIPALLHWTVPASASPACGNYAAGTFICYESQDQFLAFAVALHLATAIALLIFFWKEWITVIRAIIGSIQHRQLVYDRDSKFAWLLVAGTIPTGILGVLLEKPVRNLFSSPVIVAVFLFINGFIMLLGEYLRRRSVAMQEAPDVVAVASGGQTYVRTGRDMQRATGKISEDLTLGEGAVVGLAQSLALLPGISRSGTAMVASLFMGLTHEEAARFSFMLATPIIGLAALYKVPDLFKPEGKDILGMAVVAAIVAGICAYISVRFLMRYFETKRLDPFGYYSIVAGLIAFLVLVIRG